MRGCIYGNASVGARGGVIVVVAGCEYMGGTSFVSSADNVIL